MAVNRTRSNSAYGFNNPLQKLYPLPIIKDTAPTANDRGKEGQLWLDQTGNDIYMFLKRSLGASTWVAVGAGAGTFDSVTSTTFVIAGTTITAGTGLTVTTGTLTLSDMAADGVITNTAAGVLTTNALTDGQILIGDTANPPVAATLTAGAGINIGNAAGAITITATGAIASNYTASDANNIVPDGAGNVNILGGVNVGTTAAIANTITIDLDAAPTLAGLLTCNLGIAVGGANAVFTSVTNAGQDIYLHANGGVNETIDLYADQGTGVDSINLHSDVGGITLSGGLNTANAVNIECADAAGGVDIDAGTGGLDLYSTGVISIDALAASNFTVTGATFDLTLESAGGRVIVNAGENAAQAIYLHADAGAAETIQLHADQGTAVNSINLLSDVGGLTLTATALATDNAINIEAGAGGIDVDAALQINIASSENAVDAIVINSSAGGIDITSGGAATEDIDITASSSINLVSTENAAQSIYLHANGGIAETIQLHADQGTDPLSLYLLSDVGGITIAATAVAAQNAVNISAGAGGVNLTSALATVILSDENTNDALTLTASDGGIDITAAGTDASDDVDILSARAVNITATGNIVNSIYLHANGGITEQIELHADQGTAVDSIYLASDAGGVSIDAGLVSDDAFNISSAGGVDIDADMQINITSAEDTNDSISVNSTNGGIDIAAAGTDAGDDINMTSARAITATTTGNIAQAIYLHANAGTTETIDIHADQGNTDTSVYLHSDVGGVTLEADAGNIKLTPGTNTVAGVAITLNAKIGACTFTGQITASGAQETFTITNDEVSTTSSIIVTVSNIGGNDARMSLEQVKPAAGSFEVMTQNNGGAALNNNVVISFIVLN